MTMAVEAPRRHRASPPRCGKHASRPSASSAPSASGSKWVSAQVSVGETARGATETRQAHPLFGARYYDPTLGRWTQQDPSGQEANAYAYAGCDPVNKVDPTGYDHFDSQPHELCRGGVGSAGRFASIGSIIRAGWYALKGDPEKGFENLVGAGQAWTLGRAVRAISTLGAKAVPVLTAAGTYIDAVCSLDTSGREHY